MCVAFISSPGLCRLWFWTSRIANSIGCEIFIEDCPPMVLIFDAGMNFQGMCGQDQAKPRDTLIAAGQGRSKLKESENQKAVAMQHKV